MATVEVVGRHRAAAHRAGSSTDASRRAWLAPLLALLAVGLLPVLGRSVVWLGAVVTDASASGSATARPTTPPAAPGSVAVDSQVGRTTTPAVPAPVAAAPAAAAPPPAPRAAGAQRSGTAPAATSASPRVVPPPVVDVPPNPDPAPVAQPQDPSPQDPATSDRTPDPPPDRTPTAPTPEQPPADPCADCAPVPAAG